MARGGGDARASIIPDPGVVSPSSRMSSPRRLGLAVLDCEDAVKWDGHAIALSRLLSVDGERWEHHRCWSGELPELSELHTYAGLVVTGSHHGANDDEPWIDATRRFLAEAVDRGGVRVLGICFGCQLLARALGGKVGPNPSGRFVLRREEIRCADALTARDDFRAAFALVPPIASDLKKLALFVSHGDCVVALPPDATRLATSDSAETEIWSLGEDVLAFQPHPELAGDTVLRNIVPFARRITEEDRAAARSDLRLPVDSVVAVAAMRAFLRRGDGDRDADVVRAHVRAARAVFEGDDEATVGGDRGHRRLPRRRRRRRRRHPPTRIRFARRRRRRTARRRRR